MSSLLIRYTEDRFDNNTSPTIGVDFKTKKVKLDNDIVNLAIWDTAGSERFRALTPSFYRGAHGVIMVYDVTQSATFDKLDDWLEEVNNHANRPNLAKMVVGNKIDKEGRQVSRKAGMDWARKNRSLFIEASSKTKEGVECAFEELVQQIIDTPGLWEPASSHGASINLRDDVPDSGNSILSSAYKCFGYLWSSE